MHFPKGTMSTHFDKIPNTPPPLKILRMWGGGTESDARWDGHLPQLSALLRGFVERNEKKKKKKKTPNLIISTIITNEIQNPLSGVIDHVLASNSQPGCCYILYIEFALTGPHGDCGKPNPL